MSAFETGTAVTRWRIVGILALVIAICTPGLSLGAEGDLDPTFSDDGVAVPPITGSPTGRDVAIDGAGRIVAVGDGGSESASGLVVVRYLPDGNLDPSFSGDGMVIGPFSSLGVSSGSGVAIDDADRIVVVGKAGVESTDPVVARFLPDGTPDTSFSGDGVAIEQLPYFTLSLNSVAIDSAGRIVAAGSTDSDAGDLLVLRYLSDGTLDSSFSGDGVFVFDGDEDSGFGVVALTLDSAGRIVIAPAMGPDPGVNVMRLLPDGQLDPSFSTDGRTSAVVGTGLSQVRGVMLDSTGRIVVAGTANWNAYPTEMFFALRYLDDGTLDTSFSGDGIATTAVTSFGDRGFGLAIDLVGNVVVVGEVRTDVPGLHDFALLRYRSDGSLDESFSDDGIVTTHWGRRGRWFGVAIDQLGDIVVTGDAEVDSGTFPLVVGRYQGAGWFTDDTGSVFEDDINRIALAGITSGCNPPDKDQFCPSAQLTRGQMAAFLNRALDLPPTTIDAFVDDNISVFEDDINRIAAAGITSGCNPPDNTQFCPHDKVTRQHMAAFLVRALGYEDAGDGNLFIDDDNSIFESDIDKLATAGITIGCNPPDNTKFCPTDYVTRGQMAAFLNRAVG
jgi:uncharacterized delta-60 repeat protein